MKKSMILILALVFVLGMTCTAFAGPFADVPAKHWSYDAISKLAQAGIIDGYGDGTFRGDRTMTRYEMAQIVAKAMEKSDKADAANKALIDKLSAEYAQELDNLGVRVSNLEKKVGNVTWTGQVREWYAYSNDDQAGYARKANHFETRLILWLNAPLTKDLTFTGRLVGLSNWGENRDTTGGKMEVDEAYVSGSHFMAGRMPITLGQGILYNKLWGNDGAVYIVGGKKLSLTGAAFVSTPLGGPKLNILAVDGKYQVNKDLTVTATYAKNDDDDVAVGDVVNTWAVGGKYTGIKDFTLIGEYAQNNSDNAGVVQGNDDSADAWLAQVQWKGAQWDTPHTYGVKIGYRKAEAGFAGVTGDPMWETHFGTSAFSANNVPSTMNNVKGFEYGFDYAIFKQCLFTFNYLDLERDNDGKDCSGLTAQVRYFF